MYDGMSAFLDLDLGLKLSDNLHSYVLWTGLRSYFNTYLSSIENSAGVRSQQSERSFGSLVGCASRGLGHLSPPPAFSLETVSVSFT